MSTVTTALSSLPSTTDPTAVTAKNTLDKNSFLKLLTTQLQQQDPTSPMDSNAFVAQLAQFSSVEALENMGAKLDTISLAQANANQLAVPQMIGKEVLYNSSQVALTRGQAAGFSVGLGGDATTVAAVVQDASGRTVRTLQLGARGAGANAVSWDGLDDRGQPADTGTYYLTVSATDAKGAAVTTSTAVRGVVTGVSFDGAVPQLLVNGTTVRLSDVAQISAAPAAG
jgi:flagellar basal-body rod modification protein FlgD